MIDRCDWCNCKLEAALGYQQNSSDPKKLMCSEHWMTFCEWQENNKETQARKKLGLPPIERKFLNKIELYEKVLPSETIDDKIQPCHDIDEELAGFLVGKQKAKKSQQQTETIDDAKKNQNAVVERSAVQADDYY